MDSFDDIRARAEAASTGSWQRHGADVWVEGSAVPLFRGRDDSAAVREQADRDAEFVAHARDDVLRLLTRLLETQPERTIATGPAQAGTIATGSSQAGTEQRDPRVTQADTFF